MEIIRFDPNGNGLKINIEFIGLIAASFSFCLFETESNNIIMYEKDDNENTSLFSYSLPLPSSLNVGRLIQITSELIGLDPNYSMQYFIRAEVLQGGGRIGGTEDSGEVTGSMQKSDIFIKLEGEE